MWISGGRRFWGKANAKAQGGSVPGMSKKQKEGSGAGTEWGGVGEDVRGSGDHMSSCEGEWQPLEGFELEE